ncbi:MAG: response regulator [Bdellovibrionaceae bacterium]|nr:response regulator [Pseudobdellovibrionaceae bacterium]
MAPGSRSLLIVEDEEEIREILTESLQGLVDEFILAENGQEALDIVKGRPVDAIVSDINMPKLDGLKFLSALRDAGLHTPFVVLTGYGDKRIAVEALRHGAMDFLDKPWDPEELRKVVGKAIEVGHELNRFGHASPEADFLNEIKEGNALAGVERLVRIVEALVLENSKLRKR